MKLGNARQNHKCCRKKTKQRAQSLGKQRLSAALLYASAYNISNSHDGHRSSLSTAPSTSSLRLSSFVIYKLHEHFTLASIPGRAKNSPLSNFANILNNYREMLHKIPHISYLYSISRKPRKFYCIKYRIDKTALLFIMATWCFDVIKNGITPIAFKTSAITVSVNSFYRAMVCVISAVFAVGRCLSVRVSHWWIVSRRLKISSDFFLGPVV